MPQRFLLALYRLFDTSRHHRYSLDRSPNTTDLGLTDASITESFSECHLWLGWLVRLLRPLSLPPPPPLQHVGCYRMGRDSVTVTCTYCSVTIAAFVRLVYYIKADIESAELVTNIASILIWTGVEVNMSIVCGQYKPFSSALLTTSVVCAQHECWNKKRKLANIKAVSVAVSVVFLSRSHDNNHLRQIQTTAQTQEHARM